MTTVYVNTKKTIKLRKGVYLYNGNIIRRNEDVNSGYWNAWEIESTGLPKFSRTHSTKSECIRALGDTSGNIGNYEMTISEIVEDYVY